MTGHGRLGRAGTGRSAPPVRTVHFGAGAFHRAHQAWYTDRVDPGWGIAAVTRSADTISRLGGQDGLYTVVTRAPDGDGATVVGSIASVLDLADGRVVAHLADPAVTVVTLTLTEAGYGPGNPVLRVLVAGLAARYRAGAGPIAVVSCDNLASNGRVARDRLLAEAGRVTGAGPADAGLAAWLGTECAWPDTVVDRITPAAGPGDLAVAEALTGWEDRAAVVTEPWTEWVVEDAWGPVTARPAWEEAGARFVADVGPWARRKLRLLNAGHSLLAELGPRRGHRWVHEAVADPAVRGPLLDLWAEARSVLPPAAGIDPDAYCDDVAARWANPRLPHALQQIASGARRKLRQRVVPTIADCRRAGTEPLAAVLVVAAWAARVRAGDDPDPGGARPGADADDDAAGLRAGDRLHAARRALALLGADGRDADGRDADGWDAAGRDAAGRDAAGREADGWDADGWTVAAVAEALGRLEAH